MPQLIPLAIGVGSSLLGGLSKSGKQGAVNSNSIGTLTGTNTFDRSGSNIAWEDPLFGGFRQSLIPQMQSFINKAQQPVYGKPQQAQFLNQINQLGMGAAKSLQSKLARMGASDSGLMGQGLADLEVGRQAKAADFFSQLPFMERQAQMQNLGSALGMASGWTGRAPISHFTTDKGTETTNQKTTQQGQQTQSGPSWWKGALGGLSGVGGAVFGDWLDNGGM